MSTATNNTIPTWREVNQCVIDYVNNITQPYAKPLYSLNTILGLLYF